MHKQASDEADGSWSYPVHTAQRLRSSAIFYKVQSATEKVVNCFDLQYRPTLYARILASSSCIEVSTIKVTEHD